LFQPTVAQETWFGGRNAHSITLYYQSISASPHPQYRKFSFEELRLEDYIQMGRIQPMQNPAVKAEPAEEPTPTANAMSLEYWTEVESGHYEYILEDHPAPKPRVVLPLITKGIISISMVQKLQNNLEKTETELKQLKENAALDRDEYRKALQARLKSEMEETLKTRSEKMKSALNLKLAEGREELQKQRLKELSYEQAVELLENNPSIVAKTKEGLGAAGAEEIRKLESQFQERVDAAKKELSDAEIREMLRSNSLVGAIFKGNLKKRIEAEKEKITAILTAGFEERLRLAEDAANTAKENAVLLEGKKSALRLSIREDQLQRANAKLGIVERAVETRPDVAVKEIWEEIKQWKPTIALTIATPTFSALATIRGTTPGKLGLPSLSSSPAIFGATWNPRDFNPFLSTHCSVKSSSGDTTKWNLAHPQLSHISGTKAKFGHKTASSTEISSGGKRSRETDDIGVSEEGPKRTCKDC
jgi:hypothetical protein